MPNNLRKYRQFKGYTQTDLAKLMDVSKNTVSNWELDISIPSVYEALQIAELLHEDLHSIFSIDE